MAIDGNKLDIWLAANHKNLPSEKIPELRERVMQMPGSKSGLLDTVQFKDPFEMLLISIFLGAFGIDRFLLGHIGFGILKLLTGGGCLVFAIMDCFTIQGKTRELNFNSLMQIVNQYGN